MMLLPQNMSTEKTAILCMILSSLLFSLMEVCVKSLVHLPTTQVVFFRALISMIICLQIMYKQKINIWGTNKKLLILRGAAGTLALYFYFDSFKYLPMATAATIQKLSPIFTTFLSMIWLKERVTALQLFYFALAFSGIAFLKGFDLAISMHGLLIGILAALASAVAYIAIAKIRSSEHPMVIIFYFPLITLPIFSVPTFLHWHSLSISDWCYLIALGILVQTAQYFLTLALQMGSTSKVSLYMFLVPVFAIFNGTIIFGEVLSVQSLIGISIILMASLATLIKI